MLEPAMSRLFAIIVLITAPPLQAAEVYKTVDEYGNVIFSDQPTDGAEKIEVRDPITVPSLGDYEAADEPAEEVEPYQELVITNPRQDETYFRSEGDLVVSVNIQPRLSSGDFLVLFLNGSEYRSGKATSFSLVELDRGTHQVSVLIRDASGTVLKSSEPVTFHIRQASILNPPPKPGP
jgi:hypothetical protein